MRRRVFLNRRITDVNAATLVYRTFSDFSDGSDGTEWKQRYLQERRETALEFLGDVKKRVPIHDAIRQRAVINRSATRDVRCAKLFEDMNNMHEYTPEMEDSTTIIDAFIDDLLQDENAMDKLQHVNFGDVPLLDSELFDDGVSDEAVLRNWLKLKKDTADYQSYSSIPEAERTAWSAWYLRHVKPKGGN